MRCVTGKNGYNSEEEALESLIQNHIHKNHRKGAGPVNVYQCKECKEWHFTSKGVLHSLFDDPQVVQRITDEQKKRAWEDLA